MVNTLHILNGDSTLGQFKKTRIQGQTYVWREVMSEGPVQYDISKDEFWKDRIDFMTEYFETNPEAYQKKVIDPFRDLESGIGAFGEIVLWFEYDLFCQINMIALLSWLKDLEVGQVSLICVGKMEGHDRLVGLGEISDDEYPKLLQKRVKLNTRELTHAQDVWQTYCSPNPDDLYNFILLKMAEFQYLPDALECHLKRFPYASTGLNEIEQKIMKLVGEGITEERKIVGALLRWQEHYGFGDLQYFNTISYLKPVLEHQEDEKQVPNKQSVEKLLSRAYKLGGAQAKDWYWNDKEKVLIPKESAL